MEFDSCVGEHMRANVPLCVERCFKSLVTGRERERERERMRRWKSWWLEELEERREGGVASLFQNPTHDKEKRKKSRSGRRRGGGGGGGGGKRGVVSRNVEGGEPT